MINDTIAAVSTPRGKGGVALIRISGDGAAECLKRCFVPFGGKISEPRRTYYGKIVCGGETVDRGLAVLFEEGHSYTGETTAEITCHGGTAVTAAVLEAVLKAGARPAEPGEFTRRAFVNGRLSLTEVEAVGRLIDADTDSRRRLAASAAEGNLRRKTEKIREAVTGALAALYAVIDYPDEDLDGDAAERLPAALFGAARETEAVLGTYKTGKAIADGVKTVICGVPNSGKSSLYNRLCGEDRAIVTKTAGTTRDTLEDTVDAGGITLRLADTAGLRETEDEAEAAGVSRARSKIREAELVIFVKDSALPLSPEEKELIAELKDSPAAKIAVLNKCDLPGGGKTSLPEGCFDKTVSLSALTGEGVEHLLRAIGELWGTEKISLADDAVIWNARQRAALASAAGLLREAGEALIAGVSPDAACTLAESALAALSELDGRGVCNELTDEIFARFCVGK